MVSEFQLFHQSFELPPGIVSLSWTPIESGNDLTNRYLHQFIYPKDQESFLYGINLAEQIPKSALANAAKTGKRALANSLTDTTAQNWWMIYPVYAGKRPESEIVLDETLLGFAAAQLEIPPLLANFVEKAKLLNIALRINGAATWHPATPLLVHHAPSSIAPDYVYLLEEGFAGAGLQIEMWDLDALPFGWTTSWVLFLLFSILVMWLASIYAFNLLSYGLHLQQRVDHQTTEIMTKNAETSALVEHLKDVAITINQNGLIQSVNPAVERIFGYAPSELIHSNISLIIPELVCDQDNRCLCGAPPKLGIEREANGKHKTGDFFPVQLTLSEYDIAGQRYFSGIMRDLREQKRLVHDLETARDKAEAANQAKSEFLAAMSHEIRTPMNGVIGMLDVLAQSNPRDDQVEMINLVRESAESLLGIINDILDFSKIEADKLQLTQEPISVEAVTEKVCALLDRMAEQAKVELILYVDPDIPSELEGDALRVSQVLYNLVNNAIKFSSKQS